MSVDNKKELPWLNPEDEDAERDGNPAFAFTSDKAVDQVFKPGYALGVGPRGCGYYSFETKAAYKILIENLLPKKRGQQMKGLFSEEAREQLKSTKAMLAYAHARLSRAARRHYRSRY